MREQQVGHSRVSINLGHSTVPNSNAVCLPSAGDLNSGVGIVYDQLVSLSHATSRKHARKQDHRDELRPTRWLRGVYLSHIMLIGVQELGLRPMTCARETTCRVPQ